MQETQETALEAYAHLMLEHHPVGTALFEASELRLVAANPCYQLFLAQEWQNGHAIGHPLSEFVPGVEQGGISGLFQRVIQTGVATQMEDSAFPDSEGVMRYWKWCLSPIAKGGQVSYVLLTLMDVTTQVLARQVAFQAREELKESQETLAKDQQRLQYVEAILTRLGSTSDPRRFADTLFQAIQISLAPQAVALYSHSSEQKTFSLLASHVGGTEQQALFPNRLPHSSRHSLMGEVMKARSPLIKRLPTQSRNSQEKWWALPGVQWVVCVPLWRDECEGVLIAAFAKEEPSPDLVASTLWSCAPRLAEALAQTLLHAKVAQERERLHATLNQLPEGIILVEAGTGKVSYANPAAADMLGFTLPHFIGTPLNHSALLSPYGRFKSSQQSVFRWNFALIDALWGKSTTNQEMTIPRSDGSEIVVLSSATPIRTSHGLITEAALVFQDITALKELEAQKNEFFAVANHELRTPLTIITGFADLLEHQISAFDDPMIRTAISSIASESEHLRRLIADLLDVSRLEYAQVELKKQSHDVLALIKQLIPQYIQSTTTHQVQLTLEDLSATDVLVGRVDLLRIEQVLRNLLSNAIKYSPAGGTIQVGIRPRWDTSLGAQEILIWVTDQGVGIATADLPHIFERFYRARTFDRAISGFGIGLYLSKQIVQAHGGRIWVESTVGSGSTFFVALPL